MTREELIEAILVEAYGTGTVQKTKEAIDKSRRIARAHKTPFAYSSDIRDRSKIVDKAYSRQFKKKWLRRGRVIY
jgi:hypothetical protein